MFNLVTSLVIALHGFHTFNLLFPWDFVHRYFMGWVALFIMILQVILPDALSAHIAMNHVIGARFLCC